MPDRRDDIVAAAKELATEHGLRAVSVRAVAARAGVGAGAGGIFRTWALDAGS